jgi:hypothetical protein
MSWRKVDAVVRFQNPTAARSEQDGIYKASEVGRNKRSALRRMLHTAEYGLRPIPPYARTPISDG